MFRTAMPRPARTLAAAVLLGLGASAAHAACEAGKPAAELTHEDAQALYECLAEDMHAGYMEGDKRWIPEEFVADYRGWTVANTAPAAPGFHAGRYLSTWVNDTGAEEYLKYLEEREDDMPAGTVIAKESFDVSEDGVATAGPLFIMQKVEEGTSPDSEDWYYMMVAPNGRPQAVEVYTACVACHTGNFGYRDSLGYPMEDVRVGN